MIGTLLGSATSSPGGLATPRLEPRPTSSGRRCQRAGGRSRIGAEYRASQGGSAVFLRTLARCLRSGPRQGRCESSPVSAQEGPRPSADRPAKVMSVALGRGQSMRLSEVGQCDELSHAGVREARRINVGSGIRCACAVVIGNGCRAGERWASVVSAVQPRLPPQEDPVERPWGPSVDVHAHRRPPRWAAGWCLEMQEEREGKLMRHIAAPARVGWWFTIRHSHAILRDELRHRRTADQRNQSNPRASWGPDHYACVRNRPSGPHPP